MEPREQEGSPQEPQGDHWSGVRRRKDDVLNVRREISRQEGVLGRAVHGVGSLLSSAWFFLALLGLHLGWIVANLEAWPWWEPWDPFPFTFLATLASVEAPLFALLILMRQERDREIEEIREEFELQVELHSERQTSALLEMMAQLHETAGVEATPPEGLEEMRTPLDPRRLLESVEEELADVEDLVEPREGED